MEVMDVATQPEPQSQLNDDAGQRWIDRGRNGGGDCRHQL